MDAAGLAIEHLLLRLRPVNRALRRAAARQAAAAARFEPGDLRSLCVTEEHVGILLDDAEAFARQPPLGTDQGEPDPGASEEACLEADLRAQAAASIGCLPLDALTRRAGLDDLEVDALLLCLAPHIERGYERIYGFVLDDLTRRALCAELVAAIRPECRLSALAALGPLGRLRRLGLLTTDGASTTLLRQELHPAPGLVEFLLGAPIDLGTLLCEPDGRRDPVAHRGEHAEALRRAAAAIQGPEGLIVGIWGPRGADSCGLVESVGALVDRPIRRLRTAGLAPRDGFDPKEAIRLWLLRASNDRALVWIECDAFDSPDLSRAAEALADSLAESTVSGCLTGEYPWRPTRLLAARRYTQIELRSPGLTERASMWADALPQLDPSRTRDLAVRFRLSRFETRAAARVASTRAELNGNGHAAPVDREVDAACLAVTCRATGRYAVLCRPTCTADDLVLPAHVHAQVTEVARFARAWPVIAEDWGFGARGGRGGGVKALFTGDPGTGKTLAAEVIAASLAVPLLKVDLARIVSKWVGESSKNIDAAFREADESRAVLFFDEADALFGKRGEVRYGTDRYANVEVSDLLQRLEEYDGLVILASNLKDNIDPAFSRRFQVALHFPRPGSSERRRIWRLAFPRSAPLDSGVDLDAVAALDMTGAEIVGAARTAALLAADKGRDSITMVHLVHGIARQYQRGSRILSPAELGPHAALLRQPL